MSGLPTLEVGQTEGIEQCRSRLLDGADQRRPLQIANVNFLGPGGGNNRLDAIELGLVGDPVPDGTWVNLPVVLPGTFLEVGDPSPPMLPTQVFGRGRRIDVFELGTSLGRQPTRNGVVPIGQAAGLQTGVPTGVPPALPTAVDPQPVFQFGIPTEPPTTTVTYTPLATDVTVRLANGVEPAAVATDAALFKRSATGAITAFYPDTVATFTIGATVNNLQLQFAEGAP